MSHLPATRKDVLALRREQGSFLSVLPSDVFEHCVLSVAFPRLVLFGDSKVHVLQSDSLYAAHLDALHDGRVVLCGSSHPKTHPEWLECRHVESLPYAAFLTVLAGQQAYLDPSGKTLSVLTSGARRMIRCEERISAACVTFDGDYAILHPLLGICIYNATSLSVVRLLRFSPSDCHRFGEALRVPRIGTGERMRLRSLSTGDFVIAINGAGLFHFESSTGIAKCILHECKMNVYRAITVDCEDNVVFVDEEEIGVIDVSGKSLCEPLKVPKRYPYEHGSIAVRPNGTIVLTHGEYVLVVDRA